MLWEGGEDKAEDALGMRMFGAVAQACFGVGEQEILADTTRSSVGVSEIQMVWGFADKETDVSDGRGVMGKIKDFAHPAEPREFMGDLGDIFEWNVSDGVAFGEHGEGDALFPAGALPERRGDGLVVALKVRVAEGIGGRKDQTAFVVFDEPLRESKVVAVGEVDRAVFVADLLKDRDGLGFVVCHRVGHDGFEVGHAIKAIAAIDRIAIITACGAFTEGAVAIRSAEQAFAQEAEALVEVEVCLAPAQERIKLLLGEAIKAAFAKFAAALQQVLLFLES